MSDLAAVVGPMQQGLSLPSAAGEVARLALPLDLPDVPAHGLPSPDLPLVLVGQAAAHVVAAIPLEPAARVVGMDPSLVAPHRQRLAGVDAEEVERAVAAAGAGAAASLAAGAGAALFPSPASIVAITAPTLTVSPTATTCWPITPATGDGTSTATLSVSRLAIGSSTATGSPGCFSHSPIVASVTLSPSVGTLTSVLIAFSLSVPLRRQGPIIKRWEMGPCLRRGTPL